ncbi:MAG: NfeD family protein [Verrucomicrobiales bacterium]|nr:NfeD family protein [Verrucomicrobiales bacterium]
MDTAIIWFLVGIGLILAELAVPGVILVFFGVAALIVSLLDWIGIDSLAAQLWIFSILSLALLIFARRFVKSWFVGSESSEASDLDEEFVGKTVTVTNEITPGGFGKVELKGAQWQATSTTTLPVGSLAEVTKRDGLLLHVAQLD